MISIFKINNIIQVIQVNNNNNICSSTGESMCKYPYTLVNHRKYCWITWVKKLLSEFSQIIKRTMPWFWIKTIYDKISEESSYEHIHSFIFHFQLVSLSLSWPYSLGALLSLVTVFLREIPDRMSPSRAALPPGPPEEGGGGGGAWGAGGGPPGLRTRGGGGGGGGTLTIGGPPGGGGGEGGLDPPLRTFDLLSMFSAFVAVLFVFFL